MVRSTEGAIKAALHRARMRMKTSEEKSRASTPIDFKKLIELFISAFHSFDADLICRTYLSLQNVGYTVVAVTDQKVLYFRCQDPEGNVFHIYADTVLGSNIRK